MPNGGREIIESTRFQRHRDELMPDIRQWDEIFRGVDWALQRDPGGVGQQTDVPGVLAIPIMLPAGEPDLVVYYAFNDDAVTLMDVKIAEPTED